MKMTLNQQNRDRTSCDEDVEFKSTTSESESSESAISKIVNSERERSPSEDEETDEACEKDVSKTKNKSAAKRKPSKNQTMAHQRTLQSKKRILAEQIAGNAMTNEELEDLCFELG